ncbi:MAG: leucine-rich repeat protein, partial [Eubacterium sp.]|nr:leucine-rich repeat protein [Eubacterium sp.]
SELSGTSFSAPFVSASCALVLLKKPDATPSEIKELIKSTAIDMGEEDQFYYGAGVLSFNNLLDEFNVETPEPNVAGGKYHEAQTIDFGNDYQGTLVYTTDRTTPTSKNGIEYTGPITIDCDTQLTYALMVGNTYISPIKTANYIIQYYAPASDFTAVAGTIMKYKGDKTNIIVPDKISGLKPTALYKELFKNSNLTGIVLPDTVTTLGTGCFQDSEKLRHIVAPGVTKLNGDYVFSGCKDLRDEVMPKLRTVTTGAFKYCSRLHKIDFGASITEFKNELFYGSGLMYGDFPNAKDSEASEVFRSCPLFTCSIPKFTNLYTKFFYNCAMLHELQIGQVTKIYDSALYSCIFLKQLDASNITQLDQNALSGCCVDTFCAPNCTQLPSKLGKYCNIRVIDLPNAQGSLGTDFLNTSMTEELYMEQATSMQKHSLRNTVDLNIIYLPNVLQYYEPYTNVEKIDSLLTNDYYEQKAPLEIIWVPVAQLPETIDCYATRLIYAPSAESIHIAVHSDTVMPNVVVSDKITADNITITNSGNGAVVISKENSYAQQYSLNENCGYTFVSTDDVTYENTDERSYFTYSTENSYFSVPKRFIAPYWQEDVINKSRNELFYGFLLDFADDDVINAKDYSILVRNDM